MVGVVTTWLSRPPFWFFLESEFAAGPVVVCLGEVGTCWVGYSFSRGEEGCLAGELVVVEAVCFLGKHGCVLVGDCCGVEHIVGAVERF